jgi:transposase-like protein
LIQNYPADPPAIDKLKNDKILPKNIGIRQIKCLNNIIEQDHRSIKRIINPMLGFQSFRSANKTLKGIEIMHMIRKGQVNDLNYSVFNEVKYINQLFGIVL